MHVCNLENEDKKNKMRNNDIKNIISIRFGVKLIFAITIQWWRLWSHMQLFHLELQLTIIYIID